MPLDCCFVQRCLLRWEYRVRFIRLDDLITGQAELGVVESETRESHGKGDNKDVKLDGNGSNEERRTGQNLVTDR